MKGICFKYFKIEEFSCPDCGKNEISLNLVHMLDQARKIAGIPFKITSGYRCEKHNKEVGGKPDSEHLRGFAVDIACSNSRSRFLIERSLFLVGFDRIGEDDNFIHVGVDKNKPKNVKWRY